MRKFVVIAVLAAAALSTAACNTVAGAGKDVKTAGAAVEKKAEESK